MAVDALTGPQMGLVRCMRALLQANYAAVLPLRTLKHFDAQRLRRKDQGDDWNGRAWKTFKDCRTVLCLKVWCTYVAKTHFPSTTRVVEESCYQPFRSERFCECRACQSLSPRKKSSSSSRAVLLGDPHGVDDDDTTASYCNLLEFDFRTCPQSWLTAASLIWW